MNRLASVCGFFETSCLSIGMGVVTPAKAGVRAREKADSRFRPRTDPSKAVWRIHGNDGRDRFVLGLFLAAVVLYGCNSEVLQKQAEQIKQQDEEIARQRQELNALLAGQKLQEQQRRDCNRAFREFFDKAQGVGDRDQAIALYREGLALCPDDDVAHYELGKVLADSGRYEEAEKEFESALKINPAFIDAKKQLDLVRKGK